MYVHDMTKSLTLGILMRTLPPVPCFPRASDCMVLLNSPSSGEREREGGGKEVEISTEGRAIPEPTDVSDFLDVSEHEFVHWKTHKTVLSTIHTTGCPGLLLLYMTVC